MASNPNSKPPAKKSADKAAASERRKASAALEKARRAAENLAKATVKAQAAVASLQASTFSMGTGTPPAHEWVVAQVVRDEASGKLVVTVDGETKSLAQFLDGRVHVNFEIRLDPGASPTVKTQQLKALTSFLESIDSGYTILAHCRSCRN